MNQLGLKSKARPRRKYNSYKGEVSVIADNVLGRDFTPDKPKPTMAFAVVPRQDEAGIRLCTSEEQAYIENLMSGGGADGNSSSSSDDSSGAPSGEAKAWLKEGTEEYERAKQIYDFFTETIGTSGAFAAGVLANVEQESGGTFDPKISEGGGRFPSDHATAPDFGGPGGGAYQFTTYEKYIASPQFVKGGWTLDAESEFVWMSEFQTNAITMYMKNAPNNYAVEGPFTRAYTAIPNPKTGKTEKVLLDKDALVTTDDPVAASKGFQLGYERPAVYHPEREPSATAQRGYDALEGLPVLEGSMGNQASDDDYRAVSNVANKYYYSDMKTTVMASMAQDHGWHFDRNI